MEAPVSYTSSVSAAEGKLSVTADGAAVVLPDTDTMSIMHVTAADFTQEQVDGLISALFEGQNAIRGGIRSGNQGGDIRTDHMVGTVEEDRGVFVGRRPGAG